VNILVFLKQNSSVNNTHKKKLIFKNRGQDTQASKWIVLQQISGKLDVNVQAAFNRLCTKYK